MSISSSQEKSMKTQNEIWQEYYKQRKAPSYPTDAIARFFEKYAKSGDKVLDLGCGAGRHTLMLAQMGFEVSAIDFAKNSIDFTNELLANNSFKADLRVASADALPFCDDYFDALVCYGIHMYGDKDFVENVTNEIYRVLKKGGKAIIQFRSKDDYRYKNGEKIGEYQAKSTAAFMKDEYGQVLYYFDEAEIKRVFKDFKDIKIDYLSRTYDNGGYKISYFLVSLEK